MRPLWRTVLLACCLSMPSVMFARDWPRFRGPNGDGIGEVKGFTPRWEEKDYLWKAKLPGTGHSSPVVQGDRLFVTCGEEASGKRLLVCLRADDGKQLWVREFPGEQHRKHQDNSFASSTPAVDERAVYVCWGGPKDFLIVALDRDGKELWRADLGTFSAGHGFGPSPIVHEEIVLVPNDQNGPSSLIGLDRMTGKERWRVPRTSKASYATPCIRRFGDGPAEAIFVNYEHGITSIDPRTGKLNWEIDVFDKRHIESSIGSPVVAGELILGMSGWLGVRQEVVAITPNGGKPREVYRVTRSAPLCTTPLVVGDLLFLWSDNGIVTCADVRTGEDHWRERVAGSFYSSPVCVGKYLLNLSRDGEVVVLPASKEYEPPVRNRLDEGTHATPAIANGLLYLRTFSQVIAVGGRK